MPTHCRTYEPGDLEPLKQLLLELGYPVEFDDLRKNIDTINRNGGEIIVAEKDKKVVGSVCVVLDARLAEGLYAEIVSLVVSEQERGQGVGKMLVQQAEAWAGRHVQKIRVRANEIRHQAHAFYKGRGFQELKTQKIFAKRL